MFILTQQVLLYKNVAIYNFSPKGEGNALEMCDVLCMYQSTTVNQVVLGVQIFTTPTQLTNSSHKILLYN